MTLINLIFNQLSVIPMTGDLPHEGIGQSLVQRQIDAYRSTFSSISGVKLSLADIACTGLHLCTHNRHNVHMMYKVL